MMMQLMKKYLFLLFFSWSLTAWSQIEYLWIPHSLCIKDFKIIYTYSYDTLAVSCISNNYVFHQRDNLYIYGIMTVFKKFCSWAKPGMDTQTLIHEQGHYDIAEVVSRKYRMYIRTAVLSKIPYDKITIKVNFISKQVDSFQRSYDRATNFGNNSLEQKKWLYLIQKQLNALKDYAKPIDTFYVNSKTGKVLRL